MYYSMAMSCYSNILQMAQRITSLIHGQAHVLDQSENLEFVKLCGEQSITEPYLITILIPRVYFSFLISSRINNGISPNVSMRGMAIRVVEFLSS